MSVGLDVAAVGTGDTVTVTVGFASVDACVGLFFLSASSVGCAPVVTPTITPALLSVVGSVPDAIPSVGIADALGVTEAAFWVTEVAAGPLTFEQTLWNRKPGEEQAIFIRYGPLLNG